MFSSKISSLLNSDSDHGARNSFLEDLTSSMTVSDLSFTVISPDIVLDAISQLKNGKTDGSSLFSDAFILAKDIHGVPLSQLFPAVVRHGYFPNLLRDYILQVIPSLERILFVLIITDP